MWVRWATASGLFALAVLFSAGAFCVSVLLKPSDHDRYIFITFITLLIGIILGAGMVVLAMREVMRSHNQTVAELTFVTKQALGKLQPFYLPTIRLPQNVSFVIMAKPIRPRNPVYRILQPEQNHQFFRWDREGDEDRITFHSDPSEASLWQHELFGIQAALRCADAFGRERQIFVEELEAEAAGISQPSGQDEIN